MAGGLPPPPTRAASGDFAWTAWNNELYKLLSTTGAVQWAQVNKAGSSIADLQNKDHDLLTGLQGGTSGQHYHLTAAQVAAIGIGNHNNLNAIQGGSSFERFHISSTEYDYVHNSPYLEVVETTATLSLTTTPVILKPATTINSQGITYDSATGEFTFLYAGNYTLSLNINATSTASNQHVYIYAEVDTGSGWTVNANSGKLYELVNATTEQIGFTNAIHRVAGQKVRYKIYSDSNKVSLSTFTLPGGVGAKVPAIRIQYST